MLQGCYNEEGRLLQEHWGEMYDGRLYSLKSKCGKRDGQLHLEKSSRQVKSSKAIQNQREVPK